MKKVLKQWAFLNNALKKTLRIMRWSLFLLIVSIFQAQAISGYAQKTKLSLDFESASVATILNEIENSSEFYFLCNRKFVDLERKTNIQINNEPIDKVLTEVFRGTDVEYVITGRQIVLTPGKYFSQAKENLQPKTITGTVTNESGEPIPGVTIIVKGTTQGTITDADGNYALTNVPGNATLVFSFVGMKIQEIAVNGKTFINIIMEEEMIGIEEVVAVGYGTMKKSDLTGSIASVSSDQLNTFPTHSIEQALQGRVAGVQITSLNGSPGSEVKIRVRGSTSINANSDPLYVVDGFAGASLPPTEDIQSVEILKDASATAIYGSRGANGVILITTKRGVAGELKIEANASYSVQKISNKIDMLDAERFAQYQNDYFEATGSATVPYPNPSALGAGTDWQDVIFQLGGLQNYQVSISGGTDKLKVYSSGKYYNQEGTIIGSDYEMFNGRSNIDFAFSEKIKLSTQMQFNHYYKNGAPTQNLQSGGNGVISGALTFQPDLGIYDNNGNYTLATVGDARNNPYAIIKEMPQETIGDNFVWNTYADIEVLRNLKLHSSFGFQRGSSRYGSYISKTIIQGADNNGEARMSSNRSETIITENYLTYSNMFSDAHKVNIMAGYSYQSRKDEALWAGSNGFLTDAFLFWNLGGGSSLTTPGSSLTKWVMSSYYARFNYNYKDRYLITVTGREDGSSRFGANNKWAFFPSLAFAWNVKQEPFMQNIDKLSHLKIRASYGLTGNTEIGSYKSLARLKNVLAIMGGERVNAVVPSSVANSDLSWESTAQSDIGLDFGFLNGKINFALDYYSMTTSDLLYEVPLPNYSGYSTSLRNWGKVRNRGFEFAVNSIVSDKLFKWTTDFNISFNKNEIIELPEGDVIWSGMPGGIFASSTHIRTVGHPNGVFYGFVFSGSAKKSSPSL